MELNERIALARKQAGLSQEQLGEKLGVSRQAVSKWESGQTNPDLAYVIGMCRLFGVSSDWLLLGEESQKEAAPSRCPGCRAVVTGLDKYCPNCGRALRESPRNTYTLLLNTKDAYFTNSVRDNLYTMSRKGWFAKGSPLASPISQEEAQQLFDSAPCILARGLSKETLSQILSFVADANCYFVYRDSDGDTPEALSAREPVPASQIKAPKEPLSFGGVVAAVVVGLILAVIILSFL